MRSLLMMLLKVFNQSLIITCLAKNNFLSHHAFVGTIFGLVARAPDDTFEDHRRKT